MGLSEVPVGFVELTLSCSLGIQVSRVLYTATKILSGFLNQEITSSDSTDDPGLCLPVCNPPRRPHSCHFHLSQSKQET